MVVLHVVLGVACRFLLCLLPSALATDRPSVCAREDWKSLTPRLKSCLAHASVSCLAPRGDFRHSSPLPSHLAHCRAFTRTLTEEVISTKANVEMCTCSFDR